ncbi:MAG: adenosylcobinamide-GDP ribazoletransferase [Desulfovibrionaceae bacterium]|nr:adenosylcobinamide-GDP ribazoletransferase [Desulfovibrionaceae bacterium]
MGLKANLYAIQDALGFLTSIIPSHDFSLKALAKALSYLGVAGFILGVGLTLPTLTLNYALNLKGLPLLLTSALSALFLVGLEIYATSALHWDGLADLGDGIGSGKVGKNFWEVLHDSRVGTFGVLALLGASLTLWLLVTAHIYFDHWLPLILAPAWSRQAPLWLAHKENPYQNSRLGLSFCQALKLNPQSYLIAQFWLCSPLICLFFHLSLSYPALIFIQMALNFRFKTWARAQGGLSGDFLGAGIIVSQINFLFMTL